MALGPWGFCSRTAISDAGDLPRCVLRQRGPGLRDPFDIAQDLFGRSIVIGTAASPSAVVTPWVGVWGMGRVAKEIKVTFFSG